MIDSHPVLCSTLGRAYDALASEYYDTVLHPTCADFRWGSNALLEELLPHPAGRSICEVGAGDSLVAAWLQRYRRSLDGLFLTDESAQMLAHSRRWEQHGARTAIARADALPVRDGSVDLLVGSLADPYDNQAWWREARRVVSSVGRVVLTTPSFAWASRFRPSAHEPRDTARFVLRDGAVVDVPSLVREPAAERALIASVGLHVLAEYAITYGELPTPTSPKLESLSESDPVVVGYVAAPL
jgi:hypothetical protein